MLLFLADQFVSFLSILIIHSFIHHTFPLLVCYLIVSSSKFIANYGRDLRRRTRQILNPANMQVTLFDEATAAVPLLPPYRTSKTPPAYLLTFQCITLT
jgi:hypothetical protein